MKCCEGIKKTYVFDMDGVFVDTHTALENKVKTKYPYFSMCNVITYDFNKKLLSFDKSMLENILHKRNIVVDIESENFYEDILQANRKEIFSILGELDTFEHANVFEKTSDKIKLLIDNGNHIVFNSVAYTQEIISQKDNLLNKIFNNYPIEKRLMLGNKEKIIVQNGVFFEDSLEELVEYIQNNNFEGIFYLVNKPYNQEDCYSEYEKYFPFITRVSSLEEALNIELN